MTTSFAAIRTSRPSRKAWLSGTSVLAGLLLASGAWALPVGGVVSAGDATISGAPGVVTVTQGSQNAAINWQGFGIGQGETVQFVQPNANSVALNRVLGSDPSNIFGTLSANGKVFLVNPNGVLFGKGAQVNTAGLVASTLAISDADFMAGQYRFSGDGGSVLNQGTINADGGFVALLGGQVRNDGLISARLGTVALAAGSAMTLDVAGDGLLNITVDRGAMSALAENGGVIRANGGNVLMTARTAGGLLASAVNNTGLIEAQGVESRNGVIRLLGDMTSGTASVGGTLDVSGAGAGQSGGRIDVLAQDVTLASDARLYAGGDLGGGFVETSGRHVAIREGAVVNTLSAHGATGTWLLDPFNYTISAGGDETSAQVILSLAASNRTIQADNDITLSSALTWGTTYDLTLNAGHDITISGTVTMTSPDAALILIAGNDITVGTINASWANDLLQFTAGNDLTVAGALTASAAGARINLSAGHNLTQSAAITSSSGGAITLKADNDGTLGIAGGTVILNTPAAVTTDDLKIYYSPQNGYSSPNDYSTVSAGVLHTYMWVKGSVSDKVYDGNTSASVSFGPAGGGSGSFDGKDVGSHSVSYGDLGAASPYAVFGGAGSGSASITPATLTITANSASKNYGQVATFPGSAFTSSGLVAGETIGSVTETSAGAAATASPAGGPYAIIPSNAVGGTFNIGNYTTTYVNGVLTIAAANLVITANDASKTYGEVITFSPGAFTATGLLNGETIGSVISTSVGSGAGATVGGGPYAIVPTNATGGTFVAANYTMSYVNGALTIAPAVLTVTANNAAKPYGDTLTLSGQAFTSSGLRNGETIGTVTEVSAGTVATASVAGGPYAINPSAAAGGTFTASNYVMNYVPGVLTIIPGTLVIVADSTSKVFGQTTTFSGTGFTSTGLRNGETIGTVAESSLGAAATANVAGSPYVITASGAGGGSFIPGNYTVSYVPGALVITPAPLLITANNTSKVYGDVITFTGQEFRPTGLLNGDTVGAATLVSAGSGAGATVAGGPYAIVPTNATGGSFVPGNYTIAYANGVMTLTPAVLVVTASNVTKVFPDAYVFTGTEFTSVGLKNGESIGAVTLSSPGAATSANASSTPYVISASGASGGTYTPSNYSTTYVAGGLSVAAPSSIAGAGSTAVGNVDGGSGFTPNPLTNADYATPAGAFATNASGEGVSGGTTLPGAGAPAGVQLALVDEGVRMPLQQADTRFAQAAQEQADRNELARLARIDQARAEQLAQTQAAGPAQTYVAPHYPAKQDRN